MLNEEKSSAAGFILKPVSLAVITGFFSVIIFSQSICQVDGSVVKSPEIIKSQRILCDSKTAFSVSSEPAW